MGIVIDTNVLIDFERKHINLKNYISGRENQEFFISVITASELLHGVCRATEDAIRIKRSLFVESILKNIPILNIDLSVARVHAGLWAKLQSEGMMIGLHDLWIASICIAKRHILITSNIREFERVDGLNVECWTEKLTA